MGVVGAIVPWNYPFHNVFNPVISALFAGNGIVIKVSEYASWSTLYYGRALRAILAAAGAPTDLVQFVTGYGSTGAALVGSGADRARPLPLLERGPSRNLLGTVSLGVDKLIFVGSPSVGGHVMRAAAASLTPAGRPPGGVREGARADARRAWWVRVGCAGARRKGPVRCLRRRERGRARPHRAGGARLPEIAGACPRLRSR